MAPVDLKERSARTGPDCNEQGVRCSNKGFLPMSAADYLSLLDWTARQQRAGIQGSRPKHVGLLFERLGISVDTWCRLVKDFGRLFSVVAGQPQRIDEHRSEKNSRRYHPRREARDLLATA